jgi:hypothetical protein
MPSITKELNTVAGIVGELGRNIADAQKRFDQDYLENIEKILGLKILLAANTKAPEGANAADQKASVDTLVKLLLAIGPSRYQFTETTLGVRLNLAQTFDVGASVGASAGFGAFAVNAALTVGYGFDYEAAAECRTVIHAIPADTALLTELLGRAKSANEREISIPARSDVDAKIHDRLESIYSKLPAVALKTGNEKAALKESAE